MATSLTVNNVSATLSWTLINDLTLRDPSDKYTLTVSDTLANGTSADQATKIYAIRTTLASAGTATVDLAGSLTDAFGNALVFTKVKTLFIINHGIASGTSFTETSGENLILNTSTLTCLDSTALVIEPGGCLLLHSPKVGAAITATTADEIIFTRAGSSTITYTIAVVGLV